MTAAVSSRPRLVALLLAVPLIAAACLAQANGQPDQSEPAATVLASIAASSESVSVAASHSADLFLKCPYTLPPSGGRLPVPGISLRSLDRAHVEIANTTSRTYYYRVAAWVVLELDCGRGLVDYEMALSPIAPEETALVGVMQDVPISVEVWDRPCGEGCVRPPVGVVVVPMSSLEPPAPQMS